MYQYSFERPKLFTDEGQRVFLRCRDRVRSLLSSVGAVRLQEAVRDLGGGDSWFGLACMDRLVELGELRELTDGEVIGQHRVFVNAKEYG